jgi:phage terminase large subunit-like protein
MDSVTKRWIHSAADEYAVSQGCYFDERAADHVVEFFRRYLRHSKAPFRGQPFELLDWQRDNLVMPMFGWKRPNHLRRIERVYCEIPKKNGKSTLAAGIGCYCLVGDGEGGAEVYSAATAQEQASIVHGEAINMVDASPELSALLRINRTSKTIFFPATQSYYKALSAEAHSKEGLNASAIIIDELHVWQGRDLWSTLRYAGRARQQPLIFIITTAGDDILSVCYEQREYTQQVLRGETKDIRLLGYICAAEASDDWTDEATWFKTNPSLGKTIDVERFRADFEEARKIPSDLAEWKRYSLDIWATGTSPWLDIQDWHGCHEEFSEESFVGAPCVGGLDLSKTRDMTALVLCFSRDGHFYLLPYFWLPENTIRDRDTNEYFRVWREAGQLRATPGDVCDYRQVMADIVALKEKFDIRAIYYDPYNAEPLTQELDETYEIPRFKFGQTISNFAGPTSEFERLLIGREIHHNGHPILTWQAGHVEIKTDANLNKRPVKPSRDDPRKIDGIVAAIMGLAGALEQSLDDSSAYDSAGVMVL